MATTVTSSDKSDKIKAGIESFLLTDATYKTWTVEQTFAKNSLEDILQDRAVKDSSIFINFGSADVMRYEGGSIGLGMSRFTIYFVTTEIKGSAMPNKLITTSEEFLRNIRKYIKGFYFDSYDNDILHGNICYTTIRIDY